jgi:hypothetical protein
MEARTRSITLASPKRTQRANSNGARFPSHGRAPFFAG